MEVDRRSFLRHLGALAVGVPAVVGSGWRTASAEEARLWDDPSAWPSGNVPGPGERAHITRPIVLDRSAEAGDLLIEPGGQLFFDPEKSVTLQLKGNGVVHGALTMRPVATAVHTLRFVGIDESRFQGGGMQVLDTDVGLWVRGQGRLDISGTPKMAWNRIGTDPSWSESDELIITPTAPGDFTFRSFQRGGGVPTARGKYRAEILNLSRNVVIEGTPGGRAHINIMSSAQQRIRFVVLRHLGPHKLGRYPLHFHHCGDIDGTLVEGVVARQCGNHAFVPHRSNGITFRDCIAYDIGFNPYWWDASVLKDGIDNTSNRTRYERCVAARIGENSDSNRMAAFSLLGGQDNVCIGCVAVGVGGQNNTSGFLWPEGEQGVWTFQDCVAHNNARNGIFVWQNDNLEHQIERFVAYNNGGCGIEHGAYRNRYRYVDCILEGNGEAGIRVHAASHGEPAQSYVRVTVRGSRYGVEFRRHNPKTPFFHPIVFQDCIFEAQEAKVFVNHGSPQDTIGTLADFVNCGIGDQGVELVSKAPLDTNIRVQEGTRAWSITPGGSKEIAPFTEAATTPTPVSPQPTPTPVSPQPTPTPVTPQPTPTPAPNQSVATATTVHTTPTAGSQPVSSAAPPSHEHAHSSPSPAKPSPPAARPGGGSPPATPRTATSQPLATGEGRTDPLEFPALEWLVSPMGGLASLTSVAAFGVLSFLLRRRFGTLSSAHIPNPSGPSVSTTGQGPVRSGTVEDHQRS